MNKMHCSSNSKSLWNDPASRSRRAFSTPQPHHLGKPSERRQDRISTVLCSSRWMDTKVSYYHEKAFWIGMSKSPRKSFNRKSSSARQWKPKKKKKIRIGGERKEFTNGTTGEACLAKPSVERLPKAKTPFFRVLPVWIDAFPSFQD